MLNCFTQTRKFVMAQYNLTEAEATTIITQGVDFAMTQLVDGNWGVHAVVPKSIFVEYDEATNVGTATTTAASSNRSRMLQHEGKHLKLSADTVHWGYFSKTIEPVISIVSGEEIMVEMATHHACDDWDRMIKGDPGMEDIFTWGPNVTNEAFRGATGGGDGVHILTGPIYVENAEPGDILKVEIMDLVPRVNPEGKTFGSNAAAWW
jgi:acetamidase/formamidase